MGVRPHPSAFIEMRRMSLLFPSLLSRRLAWFGTAVVMSSGAACGKGGTEPDRPFAGSFALRAVVDTLGVPQALPMTYVPAGAPRDSTQWRAASLELRASGTWRLLADATFYSYGVPRATELADSGTYVLTETERPAGAPARFNLTLMRAGDVVSGLTVAGDSLMLNHLHFIRD